MNREIKFRGKRIEGNEWFYGLLYKSNEDYYIQVEGGLNSPDYYMVRTETVGQFTGLLDKNGKEIFEGDLTQSNSMIRKIEWFNNGYWSVSLNGSSKFPITFFGSARQLEIEEIIGNVIDNPELIKVTCKH